MPRPAVVARPRILRTLLAAANSFTTRRRDYVRLDVPARSLLLVPAAAAAIVAGASALAPAPARATSSCAAAVLDDWHNGRLGSTYAPACYREALRTLPEDIRIYSTAESDINRALLASLARESPRTTKVGAVKGIVRKLTSTKSSNAVERQAARAAADPSASTVPL